jgi:chemotaxis protein MotB
MMMMGRKHKHPEHENLERWLVSYADFITLLFATFTALYAIATAKLKDPSDYSQSVSQVFKQQDTLLKGIASIFEGHGSPAKVNPSEKETGRGSGVIGSYESLTFKPGEVKALEELVDELQEVVASLNKEVEAINEETQAGGSSTQLNTGDGVYGLSNEEADSLKKSGGTPLKGVEVTLQERGVKVSLDARLLFQPGSAQLNNRGASFLDAVADKLRNRLLYHLLHVEGHTDAQPLMNHPIYPSNWELSSARSSVVVRHLINKQGFSPVDLAAVGYADTRPIASNATKAGRANNRRIDIILFSKQVGDLMDPSLQNRTNQLLLPSAVKPKVKVVQPVVTPSIPVEQLPSIRHGSFSSQGHIQHGTPSHPTPSVAPHPSPQGFVPLKEGQVITKPAKPPTTTQSTAALHSADAQLLEHHTE